MNLVLAIQGRNSNVVVALSAILNRYNMKQTIAERFIAKRTAQVTTYVVLIPGLGAPKFLGFGGWSREAPDAEKFTDKNKAIALAQRHNATAVENYGLEDEFVVADYTHNK